MRIMKSNKYLLNISSICCGLTIGMGAIALLGWLSELRILASISHNYIPMAPNTAVAFIAMGTAAIALHCRPLHPIFRWTSSLISVCVAILGILILLHYANLIAFDGNGLILKGSHELFGNVPVGSMSSLTAGGFILAGASLFLLTLPALKKPVRNVASCLATTVTVVGCVVVFGYLYGTPIFYGGSTVPMAINTACAFIMMGMSLIHLAGAECIPTNYFLGASVRARLMRGFFPILMLGTIFVNYVFDTFVLKRSLNPAVTIGTNALLTGVIVGAIVFFIAKMVGGDIDHADAVRVLAEEKVIKIAESVFDAIVMVDENGLINYWNRAAETMFGYSKDEAQGRDVHKLIVPEEYVVSYLKGMSSFKNDGSGDIIGKRILFPARRKNGTLFYAEHSFASFQSEGSWNAVSIIRDCTEQRRYEDALKKLNETLEQHVAERTADLLTKNDEMRKLTQMVEQSPTCIMLTDTNGAIEYVNPRFLELTGYTFNEVIGKNPRVLKSGETPMEKYSELWHTITAGKTWQGEFINKKKNGGLYRELVSISPLKNAEGKISGYIAFKSDITEIRTLEEEQEKLKGQLYHSQKLDSVGRLAGGIAHDFNNKLMAIMGYSELAAGEIPEGNPAKDYVRKILESSVKAKELTQSLLAFSRRQPVSLLPVNLNSIVGSIKRLLLKTAGEKIDCELTLTDKDIKVFADSDKIEQVLMNLANNAVDAMPDGGSLTIGTDVVVLDSKSANLHGLDKDGDYGVITVSDTGMGMDEEIKAKIFDPYFTTKERGKGTGLGLPIVYGIVKQHHGHIEVISEPNKGTTFKIYLPISEKTTVNTTTNTNQFEKAKTILVAEDDEDVRALVMRIVERSGNHVIAAINGEDAIEKFEEHKDKIDMLLFDVMMPKKSGKDAYNSIKKLMPDIKVLFMSGYSENVITNKEICEEGLTVIQKPMSADNLLKKIEELWQTA